MTLVVEDAGEDDYTLLVTEDGELEARKRIPFDGVRRYTTAGRPLPTGRRTQSQFALDVDNVLDQYVARSGTQTPRATLAEDVARALRAVRETTEGSR
jgi:hypothetical protein